MDVVDDEFCLNFATVPAAAPVKPPPKPPSTTPKPAAAAAAPLAKSFAAAKGATAHSASTALPAAPLARGMTAAAPESRARVSFASTTAAAHTSRATTAAAPAHAQALAPASAPAPSFVSVPQIAPTQTEAAAPTGSRKNPFRTAPTLTRVTGHVSTTASTPAIMPYAYDAAALDSSGAVGAEAFAALSLDARLVSKLVGARSAVAGGGGGGGESKGVDESAAGGIVRGHLRDGFGLTRPTRVQKLVIPLALAGSSLIVKSETGSGKTLAFLLPIVQGLLSESSGEGATGGGRSAGTRALVIAPTRELAAQIFGVASRVVQPFPVIVPGLLSGGEKRKSEKAKLRKGCTIIIATPGRLLDHLQSTASFICDSHSLQWLVLDEADRLLDLGFGAHLKSIVSAIDSRGNKTPPASARTTFLLSATVSAGIRALALDLLAANALLVDATLARAPAPTAALAAVEDGAALIPGGDDEPTAAAPTPAPPITTFSAPKTLHQIALIVPLKWRLVSLLALLLQAALGGGKSSVERGEKVSRGVKAILFVSTCESAELHTALFRALLPRLLSARKGAAPSDGDFAVTRLHGDVPQSERVSVFRAFTAASAGLLIATDVAARGLDLPAIDLIVQADAPSETGDYVHRIGRTARRGARGSAILLLQPHEEPYIALLRAAGLAVAVGDAGAALVSLAASRPPFDILGDVPASAAPAAEPAAAQQKRKRAPEGLDARTLIGASEEAIEDAMAAEAARARAAAFAVSRPEREGAGDAAAGDGALDAAASGPMSGSNRLRHLFRVAAELRARKGLSGSVGGDGAGATRGFSMVGEAFAVAWQTLLEELVFAGLPAATAGGRGGAGGGGEISGRQPLVPLARRAYTSFVRAYATHERATRHIFHPRSLHLGHGAKAMGLRELPSKAAAESAREDKRAHAAQEAEMPAAPMGAREAKRAQHKAAALRKKNFEEGGGDVGDGGGDDAAARNAAHDDDGDGPAPAKRKVKPTAAISEFDA